VCGGDKQAGSIVLSGGRDVGTLESDVKSFDVHESVHRDTIMEVTNKMQLYRLIYYSYSALHVSGHVFAHHQEHLTVVTVSGSVLNKPKRIDFTSVMNVTNKMQLYRLIYDS